MRTTGLLATIAATGMSAVAGADTLRITVTGTLGTNVGGQATSAPDAPDSYTSIFLVDLNEGPSQIFTNSQIWRANLGSSIIGTTTLLEGGIPVFDIVHLNSRLALTNAPATDVFELSGGGTNGASNFNLVDGDATMLTANSLASVLGLGVLPLVDVDTFTGAVNGFNLNNDEVYAFNVANGLTFESVTFDIPGTEPVDTEPPTFTTGTIAACYQTAAEAEAAALASTTDVADDLTPSESIIVSASASGTCNAVVTVTLEDLAGNVATVDYLTTIDGTAPAITAPADVTVTVADPGAPVLPTDAGGSAAALDDCDPAPAVAYTDLIVPAGPSTPMQIVRTWTTVDACGNSASADQTITVDLADTDGDGLTDFDEVTLYGTDPTLADTDADGLDDGEEIEMAAGTGCPDALDPDSDGDTLLDGDEVDLDLDPCNPDTDGDGLSDDVDPLPAEPGATGEFIVDQIRVLCLDIRGTELGLFEGRRFRHRAVRRLNMTFWCIIARHQMQCGRPMLAQRILERKILLRVDGATRPRRDWIVPSPERDQIHDDSQLLIDLIAFDL